MIGRKTPHKKTYKIDNNKRIKCHITSRRSNNIKEKCKRDSPPKDILERDKECPTSDGEEDNKRHRERRKKNIKKRNFRKEECNKEDEIEKRNFHSLENILNNENIANMIEAYRGEYRSLLKKSVRRKMRLL